MNENLLLSKTEQSVLDTFLRTLKKTELSQTSSKISWHKHSYELKDVWKFNGILPLNQKKETSIQTQFKSNYGFTSFTKSFWWAQNLFWHDFVWWWKLDMDLRYWWIFIFNHKQMKSFYSNINFCWRFCLVHTLCVINNIT